MKNKVGHIAPTLNLYSDSDLPYLIDSYSDYARHNVHIYLIIIFKYFILGFKCFDSFSLVLIAQIKDIVDYKYK